MAPAIGLAGGDIAHTPLSCMAAGSHPVIRAELASGVSASSVRAYFRVAGSTDEYFVEMRQREGLKYQAVLPAPLSEGDTIRYSIVARGDKAQILRTSDFYAKVSSGVTTGCATVLNDAERRASKNIVVGLTRGDQGNFLSGFSCTGIIAKISAAGELSSLYGCSEGTLARFGPPAKAAGPASSASAPSRTAAAPAMGDASRSLTATVVRPSLSSNGLVIGGTNTIGVTAGVLNDVPISSCRPR